MIIADFTEPELEYFRKSCNFSVLEGYLFDLRAKGLALVDKMNIDLVPKSNVDETITDIQGLFVNYMHNRRKRSIH